MNASAFWTELVVVLKGGKASREYEPESKEQASDEVLGTLDDERARGLYSLGRRILEYIDDYRAANDIEEDEGILKLSNAEGHKHFVHLLPFKRAHDATMAAFLTRVEELFPKAASITHAVKICQGWRVVLRKREGPHVEVIRVQITGGGPSTPTDPSMN